MIDDEAQILGQRAIQRPLIGTLLVAAAVMIPMALFLNEGTDPDSGRILETIEGIWDGHYSPSRNPGYFLHEMGSAVLYKVGGIPLANLGSVAFGLVVLLLTWRLAERNRLRNTIYAVVLVATNPVFLASSTQMIDYVWALALGLLAYETFLLGRPKMSGIFLGLAIGVRISSGMFFAPILLTGILESSRRRDVIETGVVAGVVGAVCFLPQFIAADFSLSFLTFYNDDTVQGALGRFFYKNLYLFGLPFVAGALLVLVACREKLIATWHERREVMLLCGLMIAVCQLVFLRLPHEIGYLLPMLPFLAIAAIAVIPSRLALLVLVLLQLLYAVVNLNVAERNREHVDTRANFGISIERGYLWNDIRLRLDDEYREDKRPISR